MARLSTLPLTFVLLAASVTIGAASDRSHGPFKPVVARQKLSYIAKDMQGTEKVLYEYVGEYLRSSDGSELATLGLPLQVSDPTMPSAPPTEGRLRLARDGNTYKLDYKKKTATLVATQSQPFPSFGADKVKKEDIVGRETIDGRHCVGMIVYNHGDETGTAWRDLKYDILVRLVSFFGSKEDQVRVVLQRWDISTKQEPDESLFTLPAKWTVITPASPMISKAQTAGDKP